MAAAQLDKHKQLVPKRQVTVHTIGTGGVEDLSNNICDTTMSWALLRCQTNRGREEKLIAIACHCAEVPTTDCKHTMAFSARVMEELGSADVTLYVKRPNDLLVQLNTALRSLSMNEKYQWHKCELPQAARITSVDEALRAVGDESSAHNWVLLEPTSTTLGFHQAGSGGLDDLKNHLPSDKVLFGVLRFSFPRGDGVPPIIKHLFIHWIGSDVSVVRRGQWNSRLEEAARRVRGSCDFAFRKTAYVPEDLNLAGLIEDLGRVTCVTCSDTRQFSVQWYLEGLDHGKQTQAQEAILDGGLTNKDSFKEGKFGSNSVLRESAKHTVQIVREKGRQWKWVLLTASECPEPSSGGA
jgi:hypothetical protein